MNQRNFNNTSTTDQEFDRETFLRAPNQKVMGEELDLINQLIAIRYRNERYFYLDDPRYVANSDDMASVDIVSFHMGSKPKQQQVFVSFHHVTYPTIAGILGSSLSALSDGLYYCYTPYTERVILVVMLLDRGLNKYGSYLPDTETVLEGEIVRIFNYQ